MAKFVRDWWVKYEQTSEAANVTYQTHEETGKGETDQEEKRAEDNIRQQKIIYTKRSESYRREQKTHLF